jgi:putative peptidoglycan lipid II flippase
MKQNIIRSTKLVSKCIGISRILGFVRMVLMAKVFGTSIFASAFFIAFMIPNMFRRLFGEGALSAAFVPVFTESIEKEGMDEANKFAGKVATLLGFVLLLFVTAGVFGSIIWQKVSTVGDKTSAVLPLLTIMLPYAFFICMVALFMGMMNSRKHFFVPAATPILLNVVWKIKLKKTRAF